MTYRIQDFFLRRCTPLHPSLRFDTTLLFSFDTMSHGGRNPDLARTKLNPRLAKSSPQLAPTMYGQVGRTSD